MTYHMPSLTKKILRGKPYDDLRECQRVNGKPKIISTIYLGTPESILRPPSASETVVSSASSGIWRFGRPFLHRPGSPSRYHH